ncbi:MAG: M28 family peptidase, partial [Phycisphaeraceae bacterium]
MIRTHAHRFNAPDARPQRRRLRPDGLPLGPIPLLLAVIVALLPALCAGADEASFQADLAALTQHPHRLSGTAEGRAAAEHIEQRLGEIGIDEVFPLEMPVWQTQVERCELLIGGQTVPLQPLRPNITVNPVTPPEGLSGPLLYVGNGEIENYGNSQPRGAIVVLDYNSYGNWSVALALGAKAVIFLDHGDEATPVQPKHAGVPANFVRLYVHVDDLAEAGVDLTGGHEQVTVHSRVTWQRRMGRNIVARIPGSDPMFDGRDEPEAMVLSAHFDSFGVVPTRSPAARSAANVAALLEAAATLRENPPRRDVVLMFLDNQARHHQGAREIYSSLMMSDGASADLAGHHRTEQAFVAEMRRRLDEQGLFFDAAGTEGDRLNTALQDEADYARIDLTRQLQTLRLELRPLLRQQAEAEAGIAAAPKRMEDLREALASASGEARQELEADLVEAEEELAEHEAALADAEEKLEPVQARVDALRVDALRWDDIRRALHNRELQVLVAFERAKLAGDMNPPAGGALSDAHRQRFDRLVNQYERLDTDEKLDARKRAAAFEGTFDSLVERTMRQFDDRLEELDIWATIDAQREALRDAMMVGSEGNRELRYIVAHVSYDLADGSGVWGPVVGDWTNRVFRHRTPTASADNPGYYGRVLAALRQASSSLDDENQLADAVMRDPTQGLSFAPRPFVNGGSIAGIYRIYNFAVMTGHDGRLRDGHPGDTLDALDWRVVRRQAGEATQLLRATAEEEAISLSRVFTSPRHEKRPSWSGNSRPAGDYVRLQVIGGLDEDRPARRAVLAMWPGTRNKDGQPQDWSAFEHALSVPQFDPVMLEIADSNGRFRLIGARHDMFNNLGTLGTMFDEQGQVRATTTMAQLHQNAGSSMQVTLFMGRGYALAGLEAFDTRPQLLKVLKASTDAPLRPTQTLYGQLGGHTFFYVADQEFDDRIKLFQPLGPVLLNITGDGDGGGEGLSASEYLANPFWISPRRTLDLERLNEERLHQLRERNITAPDLEKLQASGVRARERAQDAENVREREALWGQASALLGKVYGPLRQSMDDLVHAIVMLLLLAIPFAFAMERLLVCATSVYGRIAGFTVMFLATFALLFFMHPGFAIATAPIIIFLAFAIILLSGLVIYIVVRKFRLELKAMQGHRVGLHDVEVSRMGTMLAAVGMGMSTMRRRPTRTTLTAITVVMLTFTILGFASFSRTVGVRAVYQGAVSETMPNGVLMRKLDYTKLPAGTLRLLAGQTGESGAVAGHYWHVREDDDAPWVQIARPSDGAYQRVDAVMGVSLDELDRWSALAEVFGQDTDHDAVKSALLDGGVYLPRVFEELLELEVGDTIRIGGHSVTFAGTFEGARLQRLRHLDGQSVLPVSFQDLAEAATGAGGAEEDEETLLADEIDRDFVHLSADQVAIASTATVRRMGGNLHLATLYPDEGDDTLAKGRELAQMLVMPIWASGPDGVERMILTVLTEVSGGVALFVPVLLGGLIIFGTLLGS